MSWSAIKKFGVFILIWVLAIQVIEYQGSDLLLDIAGDFFGAMGLIALGIFVGLEYSEQ